MRIQKKGGFEFYLERLKVYSLLLGEEAHGSLKHLHSAARLYGRRDGPYHHTDRNTRSGNPNHICRYLWGSEIVVLVVYFPVKCHRWFFWRWWW